MQRLKHERETHEPGFDTERPMEVVIRPAGADRRFHGKLLRSGGTLSIGMAVALLLAAHVPLPVFWYHGSANGCAPRKVGRSGVMRLAGTLRNGSCPP